MEWIPIMETVSIEHGTFLEGDKVMETVIGRQVTL